MMNITANSELSNQLAFLLLDDVEQYENEFKNYVSRIKDDMTLIHNDAEVCSFDTNFRKFLLFGRRKNIKDWDLKMLCALILIVQFFMNILGTPISDHINPVEIYVVEDREKLQELHHYCRVVAERKDELLSTVKMNIHKLVCGSNFMKILTVLKALYVNTYGHPMKEDLEIVICRKKIHPLSIAFRCIADGQLHENHPSIVTLMEDIDKCVERQAHIIHQNPNGVGVAWGECLIINQTFQNVYDSKGRCYYRSGTEHDEEELKIAFEQLGCKNRITVKRD